MRMARSYSVLGGVNAGVRDPFLNLVKFKLGDETQLRFWEDKWLGNDPLMIQYPGLYNIARPKFVSISEVLASTPPNISWRRSDRSKTSFMESIADTFG